MTGIIWARESNQHDKNEYSIKSQIDACRKRADGEGVPVGYTFTEKFSGRDLHRMPRLTEMRRLIENLDGPKVIYAYAQDRLVRGEDAFDIFYLLVEFRRYNAEVRFILNPVDLGTIAGQIQMLIAGHEASGEIAKILDRTQRGKIKRMQEGKVYGSGTEKYGYIRDKPKGTVSLNADESAILRRIARLMLDDGLSMSEVCRKLNGEGIPSPLTARGLRQGVWSNASLGRMLKDSTYKGEGYGHRYAKSLDGKSVNYSNRSNWIAIPVYPPIFTPDEWDRLQLAIRQRRSEQKRNTRIPALLRGLVICGNCQRRMVYQVDNRNPKRRRAFYECKDHRVAIRYTIGYSGCKTRRIRDDEIDPLVWGAVTEVLTAPQFLRNAIERRPSLPQLDALRDESAMLASLIQRKTDQQTNLIGQLADTPPAVAGLLRDRLAALEAEKSVLASQIEQIARQLSSEETPIAQLEKLDASCLMYAERTGELSFDAKRRILAILQVQVLSKDGIWYVYCGLGRIVLRQVSASPPHNNISE